MSLTQYKNNVTEPLDGPEEVVESNYFDAGKTLTLSLGLACAAMYLVQLCVALSKKFDWLDEHSRFAKFFVASNVRGAARLKKAATHKISLMLDNARRMHGPISAPSSTNRETAELSKSTRNSNTDPIFRNFVLSPKASRKTLERNDDYSYGDAFAHFSFDMKIRGQITYSNIVH